MALSQSDTLRHKKFNAFLRRLECFFKLRFHYSYEHSELPSPPYIVVSNHTTDVDAFLIGFAFPHMYYVASSHLVGKGLISKLLQHYIAPIWVKKGAVDVRTVIEMQSRLKAGHIVCLFPEGILSLDGRTAPLHPTTGKLVRMLGVPLITFKFKGGFFSWPRWSMTRRKGYIKGAVQNVYAVEQLKNMTDGQVFDVITNDIYEDAYNTQKFERIAFKGRKLAKGLETALYACPKCEKIGTLLSTDRYLKCSCGFKTKYDVYGYFDYASPLKTFTEWYDWQRECLESILKRGEEINIRYKNAKLFSVDVANQKTLAMRGDVMIDAKKMCVGETAFTFRDISQMQMYGRNKLAFTVNGQYYQLIPDQTFNARLVLHLFDINKH